LSISIVVPCYRSAETLPTLAARVESVMSDLGDDFELILVVDGSPDNTWDVAQGLAATNSWVHAIHLARNYGQHSAVIAGIRSARHDVIVTMDDDLQHPPEEIPKLLAALTDDTDLVYGVSVKEEHGFARSFASRLIKAALSGPLGVQNARMLSAFRAFRTPLRGGFEDLRGPNVSVDMALSWATTRVRAAPVRMDRRAQGRSGYSLRALFRHALNMIIGYSTLPLRFVTYLGLIVGLIGVILFARVLWLYFAGETTVAGYTTVASMVAIFSAAQMIAVGVLGEYVGRIHSRGLGRPTYVIRQSLDGRTKAGLGGPGAADGQPAHEAERARVMQP
jgi:undecaprenyl-phosphate 4-deoxy-4-formamido-L-arabinose transferase